MRKRSISFNCSECSQQKLMSAYCSCCCCCEMCKVCDRRFINNSALACHRKMHSASKYYMCRLCDQGFDQIHVLRSHGACHADPVTGMYSCPWCHKTFDMYGTARRHARSFHSQTYTCTDCGKMFPRPDKLKLHRLRHSTHREFMCDTCGRQFKRKVVLLFS